MFASLLQRTLPPGSPIGPALLVVRGFGTLLAAAFLADVGPVRTASGFLHVAGFVGGTIAFGIGLFFLAQRMVQDESWQRLAPYTVATALASLAVLGLFVGLGPRYVGDTSAPLSSIGGSDPAIRNRHHVDVEPRDRRVAPDAAGAVAGPVLARAKTTSPRSHAQG